RAQRTSCRRISIKTYTNNSNASHRKSALAVTNDSHRPKVTKTRACARGVIEMVTTLKALTGRTGLRDKQIAAHLQVIKRFRDFNDLDGLLKLQAMWERTGEH